MQKVKLSNQLNSLELTKITMGDNGMGNPKRRPHAIELFEKYLEMGGNSFDTARMYNAGLSERNFAPFLKEHRDSMVLVTKCAHHDVITKRKRVSPCCISHDVHKSLRALKTDCLDVPLLHRDNCKMPVSKIMPTLDKFVKDGKVRIIGASNWSVARMQEANDFAKENGLTPFSVSQINYSLAYSTPPVSRDTTHVMMNNIEYEWYQEENMPVMAWSPQAKGFFTQYLNGSVKKGPQQRYGWSNENKRRAARLQQLSEELNVPIGALVISYLTSQPIDVIPVCGASNMAQFEEVMLADTIKLTPAQLAFLETGK